MFSKPVLFKSYSDHPSDAHLRVVLHRSLLKASGEFCTHVENMAEGCQGMGWGHYHSAELTQAAVDDFNARGVPSKFSLREVQMIIDHKEESERLQEIIRKQTFAIESVVNLQGKALGEITVEELSKYAALGTPYKKGE